MAPNMATQLLPTALFSVLLMWQPVSALEVKYFYSPLRDSCAWGGSNTFPATNLTTNGGVCAYVPSQNRLYACPAPDANCWGFNVNCLGGTSETAGPNQILCGKSNARQWCCGEQESCTTTPGQINVCIPAQNYVPNPNAGVSPSQAQAAEFAALPNATITTALPSSTPSVFSTLSPTSSSSSSSTASGGGRSGANNPSNTNTANAQGSNNGATGGANSSSSGISGGAIAGIVIGAIALIALIAALVLFLLMRKRRSNQATKAVGPDGGVYEQPSDHAYQTSPYPASASIAGTQEYYGDDAYAKHAPVDTSYQPVPAQQEQPPQELPSHTKMQELP